MIMGIIAPLFIDEYAPSMPAMLQSLHTTAASIQLTIGIMLLGLCLGQIIFAPLSDRFGRRPILLFGLILTLLATLLCLFSQTVNYLLIGRFLQGAGVAAAAFTTTTLIGELFTGEAITRVTGLFVLVYGFVPIISPVIGGHIQVAFGWRANFGFLFIASLLALILFAVFIPETVDRKKTTPISLSYLKNAYKAILSNKQYMRAVAGAMLSWASIITFSLLAPFLIQDILHFSAVNYGYLALLAGLGFLAGNFLNTLLLKSLAPKCILSIGIYTALLTSLLGMLLFFIGFQNIWTLMLTSFLILLGVGLSFPTYYGFAVSVFTKQYVGIANALIGALVLIGTVVYTIILSHCHAHSFNTLGAAYLTLALLNFLLRLSFV